MDLAFGADEQNFEVAFPKPVLSGGELLYIDGTEYGGIVDEVTQSTETENVVYKGRTWHGMLAGKIVKPPSNADYYVLSGDANACIALLLTKVGLTDVLTARSTSAGISVNYQFERFCNAYDGLLKMLSSANAVLRIERHNGITELWAEPRVTITDEADSDIMDFALTASIRVPNCKNVLLLTCMRTLPGTSRKRRRSRALTKSQCFTTTTTQTKQNSSRMAPRSYATTSRAAALTFR